MLSNRQLFQRHIAQTSDSPLMLEIIRAEGIYMFDDEQNRYMDLISGISVSNLGHCHPAVVDAVKQQAETYMHLMVYGEYVQSPQVKLAEAISNTLPKPLDSVYFVNSGSEAVEGAMKLAKKYTGRSEIISAYNGYHGSTQGTLSLSSDEELKKGYGPFLPHIKHIEFGNKADLTMITEHTACVILETIQGEAGIIISNADYWQNLKERCNETGTLLIADEIQTGFGRTGKFWGFEHYGFVPDIIVSAKGMGSGMPIGAFVSSKKIMEVISINPILGHITTFGGHPVSAAGALAGLEFLLESTLIEKVEKKGQLFVENLRNLPGIQNIRQKGLMIAIEFSSHKELKTIIDRGIEMGIITDWFLYNDQSMRIAPPLIITEDEINTACELIRKAVMA